MKAKSLRTLLPLIMGGTLLSDVRSQDGKLPRLPCIMTPARSSIAQPAKAARSSLDIAYQLAGRHDQMVGHRFSGCRGTPESVEALMLGGLALFAVGGRASGRECGEGGTLVRNQPALCWAMSDFGRVILTGPKSPRACRSLASEGRQSESGWL